MKIDKIVLICVLALIFIGVICLLVFSTNNSNVSEKDENKLTIVTTNFVSYDFVKHIVGDKVNIEYLLKPGVELHGYDPTAQDVIKMSNADLVIYVGTTLETWMEKVKPTIEQTGVKVVSLVDMIELLHHEEIDGAQEDEHEGEEHHHEFDEHVWTSPANAIIIVENLITELSSLLPEYADSFNTNGQAYIAQIRDVQAQIQEIVDNKVRDRLIFGDKMPMAYFIHEYGLQVSAAFGGCSTETEPSEATIANLINKVKEYKIPVVLYVEMSTGKVAKTIAQEAGATAMQIQTMHNVSKEDFNNGETYVSLMTRNLSVLKAALQ